MQPRSPCSQTELRLSMSSAVVGGRPRLCPVVQVRDRLWQMLVPLLPCVLTSEHLQVGKAAVGPVAVQLRPALSRGLTHHILCTVS